MKLYQNPTEASYRSKLIEIESADPFLSSDEILVKYMDLKLEITKSLSMPDDYNELQKTIKVFSNLIDDLALQLN